MESKNYPEVYFGWEHFENSHCSGPTQLSFENPGGKFFTTYLDNLPPGQVVL